MKVLKIFGGIIGALALLVIGAAVIVPLVVNPNDYKAEIESLAQEHTGRQLTIDGDIKLSIFPWLGAELGRVTLGNAPGFAAPYFAQIESMLVRVKLMPLLGREIEMDTVEVNGLKLELAKNDKGVTNWDDFAKASGTTNGTAQEPKSESGTPIAILALGGIDLRNAALSWNDASTGALIKVQNLQAQTGAVTLGQPIELALEFDVDGLAPGVSGHVQTRALVSASADQQSFAATGIEFLAKLRGASLPGGQAEIKGSAKRSAFDTASQKAQVEQLKIVANGLAVGDMVADVEVQTSANMDLGTQVLALSDLRATGKLGGKTLPEGGLPFEVVTSGQIDLGQQTLGFGNIQLSLPAIALDGITGSANVEAALAGALSSQHFKLTVTSARGNFKGTALPEGKLDLEAKTEIDLDLANQTLSLANTTINAANMDGKLDLQVTQLLGDLQAKGKLVLARFNPRSLMALAGQAAPATRDPNVLTSASLKTDFAATRTSLSLDKLDLALDDSRMQGKASVPDLTKQALVFDLRVDKMDVDRYLPPNSAAKAKKGAAQSGSAKTAGAATPGAAAVAASGLPVEMLRALDLNGRLRVDSLRAMQLSLKKVDLGLKAKGGLIEVKPLKAALYGGKYTGAMALDARGKTTKISVDEHLTGVRADRLLKALAIDPGVNLSGGASSLSLKANATGDTIKQTFSFKKLDLKADLAGKDFPKGRLKFGLSADVDLDLAQAALKASNLVVSFAGAKLQGNVAVSKFTSDPRFTANIVMPKFNPRKVIAALGQKAPRTADKRALGSAELAMNAAGSFSSIDLKDIKLKLDQTSLTGSLGVKNFSKPAIKFDLKVDAIDADRYLPPAAKPKKQSSKRKKKTNAATPGAAAALLPVELLRALNLDGQLRIGSLKLNNLRLSKMRFTAKAKDGHVSLHPLNANLYQGKYKGNVRIDASGKRPKITLDETLSNVQAGRLLKDLNGVAALTGRANASAKLVAYGPDERTLRKTVTGNAAFAFKDGVIKGVDMLSLICGGIGQLAGGLSGGKVDAGALLGSLLQQIGKSSNKSKSKQSSTADGTKFAELAGTVQVKKGIATNRDLNMRSPLLRVGGSGRANLVTERLNYLATASLVSSCQGQGSTDQNLRGIDIPVKITGSFSKPRYEPQLAGLFNSSRSNRKPAAARPSKKKATKPQDAINDLLKGGLKGLFGN